ncbi:MFS transporter [Kitasatospora cathayae]|uniref:MFS transporter n=1 Tax=Kitasatospora cathayae TaxID=3004092 RepID=A0ABY7QBS8_9ACTN|nr:MFS transporter [Kitasatospora sp. HUAS 3-15]WBP90225.1 MFS transporter [Kitasatospora sp. HUAS 3-15]
MRGNGLWAQLRQPPGGPDARIMLLAQGVDRTGSGVWAAASVLYFTYVCGMDAGRLGLLLGVGAVAGIIGSPLAGRAAERLPLRGLLIGCHLLRVATMGLLLVVDHFAALLLSVALTCLAERGAKTLEMLFATRVAGERRATYQALFRSVANGGYAVGTGFAAIGLAVGSTTAYRALIVANALSYLLAALLIRRTTEPAGRGLVATPPAQPSAQPSSQPSGVEGGPEAVPSPWRDRGYLLFVLLDLPMCLDDSVLNVGLPLWLIHHTDAPHAVVPAFLTLNTVLVVVLQLRVSAWAENPRGATTAVGWYGVTLLASCLLIALSTGGGPLTASLALLAAAALVTLAELMRSVSSWELAVSLAPPRAKASYLGVAGMSQSVQKSVGPMLLTGVVMAAGPAGWLALGAVSTGLAAVQRRASLRRLAALEASAAAGVAVAVVG